jgi:hypothetical protein
VKAILTALFISAALVSCGRPVRDFSAIGPVTTITVSGMGASNLSKKITDTQTISQIVAFTDAHRSGWSVPWYGIPVPSVVVEFYNGTEFKGSFGVGKNFLETQRDGGFFSQSAAPDVIDSFLAMLAPKSDSQAASIETKGILDGDFTILTSVERLPIQVKTGFAALLHRATFEMADPDQDFQVGDVITRPGLARRRLIFAGISDTNCFLHYEMGGRAHSFYLVVF